MTAPTPDLDSMTARAVDRVHEDALADSRSLDKDDLTRLARYISDGFEAESDAALATVTAERDQECGQHEATKSTLDKAWDDLRQARQMLADAEKKIASMELDESLREEDERFADPL